MALDLTFAFDPQKGETPETVARRRAFAEMIMGRRRAPQNIGEGFASMMEGLVAGMHLREAERAQKEGQASAAAAFNPLLDAYRARLSGGFPAAPSSSNVSNPGNSTAMASMPAPDIASARVAQAHGDSTLPAGNLSERKQAFIQTLLPAAIEESKRTGVDPRIIVAQAAQETGWGRSAPGNNYFGIKSHGKGGGQALKTHEYINGKRVNVTDSFRTFASPEDSVRGYGDFILQNKRYKALREAKGLDAQLAALQASGYATDPNYSRSVGAIARSIPLPEQAPAPQVASGLTPDALQAWGANAYAPPMPANSALDAVNALGTAEPVPVAETEEEILAQEAAMAAQDPQAFRRITPGATTDMPMLVYDREGMRMAPETPNPARMPNAVPYAGPGAATDYPQVIYDDQGFRVEQPGAPSVGTGPRLPQPVPQQMAAAPAPQPAPPLPDPRMVQDLPVAGVPQQPVQVAQAGGFPEMAGNNPQALPAPGPSIDAILNVLTHPFASEQQRALAQMFLDQHMQAQDPMRQLEMEKKRLEVEQMRNPTPKDTDDIREYQFAVQQGYQGTFQDFMLETKRAGAPTINNNIVGDKKYHEVLGGKYAEAMDAILKEGRAAPVALGTLRMMERQLSDPKFYSGAGSEQVAQIKRWAKALGMDAEGIDSIEAFNSLAKAAALDTMGGSLGSGFSNADRDFVLDQVPNLNNTPEGNKKLIEIQRKLQERKIEIAKMAREYARANDGIIDLGFDDMLADWAEANPLFIENDGGDWKDFGGVKIRRKQ